MHPGVRIVQQSDRKRSRIHSELLTNSRYLENVGEIEAAVAAAAAAAVIVSSYAGRNEDRISLDIQLNCSAVGIATIA